MRPPLRFEFATAGRIVFGTGALTEIGSVVRGLGRRAFVVTGKDPARAQPLLERLAAAAPEIGIATFSIEGEPTTRDVMRGRARARVEQCDFVIGFGGGSALDAGKAIAALMTNTGDLFDHLEVVGRGQPLKNASAPFVAIPTTAGTGSEVTRNSVLSSPAHQVKASLRSPLMLPRVAIVDPALTHGLPPALTASTGLDALTQVIEPYVSSRANPLTDAFCVDGIRRAAHSLRRAVENGRDAEAREDMALASVFGGLALANAGLGAVHGFANPIGGMFPAPHGAICGALLPHVIETNIRTLRARAPEHEALRRYDEVARLLTGRPQATAEDAIAWTRDLVAALHVPTLAAYGVKSSDAPALAAAAARAASTKANPIALTKEELAATLTAAL
jgi:alcohol dehydrogenase class IV